MVSSVCLYMCLFYFQVSVFVCPGILVMRWPPCISDIILCWPSGQYTIDNVHSPRAILITLMTRIIVGLIGISPDLISSSSSIIPITDSSTMATSSWFHLENQPCTFQQISSKQVANNSTVFAVNRFTLKYIAQLNLTHIIV